MGYIRGGYTRAVTVPEFSFTVQVVKAGAASLIDRRLSSIEARTETVDQQATLDAEKFGVEAGDQTGSFIESCRDFFLVFPDTLYG